MAAGQIQNPHLDSSPFFFEGGRTGVLLLHGFTATLAIFLDRESAKPGGPTPDESRR